MNKNISLECNCGSVKGHTDPVSEDSGNRLVCYCKDCQKFAHQLKSKQPILNEYGGTDIFQIPISFVKITQGKQNIACMRLTSKGLYRWYSNCCDTPIGNTMSAAVPFIGVFHNFMKHKNCREQDIGEILCHLHTKSSTKPFPKNTPQKQSIFRVILRCCSKILIWKAKGLNKPNEFFDSDGKPISKPLVLDK
jgi:hypothetical protein